jgi:TRAP-type C4-dicarboxylate transport system permease small subunit
MLLALFALGLSEIVLRNVFAISLDFSIEYAGYFLVLTLFLGAGWTMREGGHIRVNLVGARLAPGPGRALDIACTVVGLLVCGFMAWSLLKFAFGTLARGTLSYFPSATPIAYPQLLIALGPCVLELALAARLIRLLTGRQADLDRAATE